MLAELRIRDLAVIADMELVLPAGMTAVTGETGAGKTMLVEAIELLVGGRSDGVLVRAGASEAWVEGRFVTDDDEVVLSRAVPAAGRSRAYLDGRMAPVSALARAGADLVDLHGQHSHQSLLAPAVQRSALDHFAVVDHGPLAAARRRLQDLDSALAELGGTQSARAREMDLLAYQVAELDGAGLSDPGEDGALEEEEDRLAHAAASRHAALSAMQALSGDGGAMDAIAAAAAELSRHRPLDDLHERLRAVGAEMAELASDLRTAAEHLEDDPERLEQVRARRALLRELCRKYGPTAEPASLTDVIDFAVRARARMSELQSSADRGAALERERAAALAELATAEASVGAARRRGAPQLAAAVEAQLRELAMPKARFVVQVGEEEPGDEVVFLLEANPGEPALPLAKVASGGELSRCMLALRLVLGRPVIGGPVIGGPVIGGPVIGGPAIGASALRGGPPGGPATLVFDEVDAGIGGEAALAVGRALGVLAAPPAGLPSRQVLVVTHLPQVAAFADHQVAVHKTEHGERTMVVAQVVTDEARVVELSRMLSGQPQSAAARDHAEELLAVAAKERGR